ncbi:hypothetical protein ACJX0J_028434 [Zea mays]
MQIYWQILFLKLSFDYLLKNVIKKETSFLKGILTFKSALGSNRDKFYIKTIEAFKFVMIYKSVNFQIVLLEKLFLYVTLVWGSDDTRGGLGPIHESPNPWELMSLAAPFLSTRRSIRIIYECHYLPCNNEKQFFIFNILEAFRDLSNEYWKQRSKINWKKLIALLKTSMIYAMVSFIITFACETYIITQLLYQADY